MRNTYVIKGDFSVKNKDSVSKKLDNFFYHYKVHVIFGTIGLIVVSSIIYSIITNKIEEKRLANEPIALEILIFGDYKIGNQEADLEKNLEIAFPDWEKIRFKIEYVPTETDSFEDIAEMQRGVAVLHTERPDVYIYDRHEFEKFFDAATYVQLDDYFTDEAILVKAQGRHDSEEHVYGIDITDSKLFSNLEINTVDKIAVISDTSERQENAIEFIKKALEE